MLLSEIRKLCLSFPAVTEQIQWEKDLLFKVGGKMFLCMGTEPGSAYSIKCSDETFHELTETVGIRPAPYLARAKWVQIQPAECRLDKKRIRNLIRESYDLVFEKLPKKKQKLLLDPASLKKKPKHPA